MKGKMRKGNENLKNFHITQLTLPTDVSLRSVGVCQRAGRTTTPATGK